MNKYKFSLAADSDIPEIVNIYRSLIGVEGCTWSEDYPNKETAREDIGRGSLYTLKENSRIVAVASLGKFDELKHLQWSVKNPLELARIGVIPTLHKRGIGTIILQHIISEAAQRGADGLRFLVSKTNPAALALYDQNGFTRCGEVFMYEIDFYCYEMKFYSQLT